MKKMANTILLLVASLGMHPAVAEIAVIVAPTVAVDSIDVQQLERLYLDKPRSDVTPGVRLIPVDQAQGSKIRQRFVQKVLGQSEQELARYWSRRMFSGKGRPPQRYDGDRQVIEEVTRKPGTLGYIDGASVTEATKVILRLP